MKSATIECTMLSLYIPPRPQGAPGWGYWQRTIDALVAWVQEVSSSLPQRTVPILGMD